MSGSGKSSGQEVRHPADGSSPDASWLGDLDVLFNHFFD